MAQEPVHVDDLAPVPGLPPADQNPPGPGEYADHLDFLGTHRSHVEKFGPGKPISEKVQESNEPPLYQNEVINPRVDAGATNDGELWQRRAEQNLATPTTIEDERPVQDQPLTPLCEAIAGLETTRSRILDETDPLPFARTLLPTIGEVLAALRELDPDTPWPDAYGTASEFVEAVMHGEVIGGLQDYFGAKVQHALETKHAEQERDAEVQKLRPGEELQDKLSELKKVGKTDKRGRDPATAPRVADLTAEIARLGEAIQLDPKINVDGNIPMENAEAAMRELRRVDQWVDKQRRVVHAKTAAARQAIHDACNGESSVEAQRHKLEQKKLHAQHLTRERKKIYTEKQQQIHQSRQKLDKERREQEDQRRAEHAEARSRREDYESFMNVMEVEIAKNQKAMEELARKHISLLNAVRKREQKNRADEAEYQVQIGIADRNLEAIARCEALLAKHEPVFVKSRELVDKVGKAADQAMDGVIAHVRDGVLEEKQNEDTIAVAEFGHYCRTKTALMERFLQAGRNRVLCEQRIDQLDLERERALELDQYEVSEKLATEAQGKEAEMDAYRMTQEELGEKMRGIDRDVEATVKHIGDRVYDGAPTDAHTRRLKDQIQQWVRVPPPVHPKHELEQKAKQDDYRRFAELVDKQDKDAASLRDRQGKYVEQLRSEAMLADRPADCAAGPEEGVPPGAGRGRGVHVDRPEAEALRTTPPGMADMQDFGSPRDPAPKKKKEKKKKDKQKDKKKGKKKDSVDRGFPFPSGSGLADRPADGAAGPEEVEEVEEGLD